MTLPALAVKGALAAALTLGGATLIDRRATAREAAIEAAFPPEGQILDVGGVAVHAVVRGDGPDLVLIHGASGNTRDFTFALMEALAPRYRVIAMDRPGLGYTGRTDPAYDAAFSSRAESPMEQAALLKAAATQLGADAPIVLGHSFGGAVALAWALDGGPSALVLLSAAAMEWPGGLGPVYGTTASATGGAAVIPLLTATVPDDYLARVTARIFAPDPVPPGYDAYVGGQLTLRRDSLRANARQVNGLKPHVVAMQVRYPDLALPIEWVHGTADTIVPADIHAEPFARLVPHTNLTLVEGLGHMPHHADPDAVIAAIDRAAAAAR